MAPPWMLLAFLNASVLTLVPMSLGLGWANIVVAGVAGRPPPHPDLLALGLDRIPSSWDGLRRAYRAAAKAAHPDTGGSADAFRAVSEALERLARRLDPEAA